MIFVAVGTQKFQLNRLLQKIDKLCEDGLFEEPIFAQIGNSTYLPKNYEYERFLEKDDFENAIKKCNLLITHSGVATIVTGLKFNKPIIVFPRLAKYGEHVDDHQIQIAESFALKRFVLNYNEKQDLQELICEAKTYKFEKYVSNRKHVIETIDEYIITFGR